MWIKLSIDIPLPLPLAAPIKQEKILALSINNNFCLNHFRFILFCGRARRGGFKRRLEVARQRHRRWFDRYER
jgi:hypothetical protein